MGKKLASVMYVVYYALTGAIIILMFALFTRQLNTKVWHDILLAVAAAAAVSAVPLYMMYKTKAPVSMYIISCACTLAACLAAAFNVLSVGVAIHGVLLGILLAFIYEKKVKTLLLCVMSLCVVATAVFTVFAFPYYSGYVVVENNMVYRLNGKGYTLIEARAEEATVAQTIKGRPVTKVEKGAFGSNNFVIDIPAGVDVPFGALENCISLIMLCADFTDRTIFYYYGVDISDSKSEDDMVLYGMEIGMYLSGIKAYGTGISNYALAYVLSLKYVTVTATVKTIGLASFAGCYSLISVSVPEQGLVRIGDRAFDNCTRLSNFGQGANMFTLPETLTSIGFFAFQKCEQIAKITIPKGVERVGSSILYGVNIDAVYVYWNATPSGWDAGWNILEQYDGITTKWIIPIPKDIEQ